MTTPVSPTVPSDLEIARAAVMRPIHMVAADLGVLEEELEPYGRYKAKLSLDLLDRLADRPDGKLILVTAINPTSAGEGKTTVTIGLAQALHRLGHRATVAMREPSLGPSFGMKGGAAGGGYAQVVPMEDLNLHFTGDLHAIAAANNLLAAMIDNHLHYGNALGLDPRRITWRRCLDLNDRALRSLVVGLGGKANGMPREDGFDITAASEVMATLCLATGHEDLRERLGRLVVGETFDGRPVTAEDLKAAGAMAVLLRDALMPNLIQTLEGTPALAHGGPFANIAHGCNSVLATRVALKLSDYVVTEAGFGADLGMEKFLDLKCRAAGLSPSAVVLVATVRALKLHGGAAKDSLAKPDLDALARGVTNLEKHLDTVARFGLTAVVAINRFPTDTDEELDALRRTIERHAVPVVVTDVWAKGGAGGTVLAAEVVEAANEPAEFRPLYRLTDKLTVKLEAIARQVYGADGVELAPNAVKTLERLERWGYGDLPVCVAKTQYSLSDNPSLLGRPSGFTVKIRDLKLSAGAGFIVAYAGDIMTMPGLPRVPAAERIDLDEDGRPVGLS